MAATTQRELQGGGGKISSLFHTVASYFWMESIKFTHVICVKSVKLLVCRHDVDTQVFSLFTLRTFFEYYISK